MTMIENSHGTAVIPPAGGARIEISNARESSPKKINRNRKIEMAAMVCTFFGAPIVAGVAGTTLFHTYAAHRALGGERAAIEQNTSCAQTVAALGSGKIALKGLTQETSTNCRLTTLNDVQNFLNDKYGSSVSIGEATVPAPASTTVNGWISHDTARLHADEADLSHDGVSISFGILVGFAGTIGAIKATDIAIKLRDQHLAGESA